MRDILSKYILGEITRGTLLIFCKNIKLLTLNALNYEGSNIEQLLSMNMPFSTLEYLASFQYFPTKGGFNSHHLYLFTELVRRINLLPLQMLQDRFSQTPFKLLRNIFEGMITENNSSIKYEENMLLAIYHYISLICKPYEILIEYETPKQIEYLDRYPIYLQLHELFLNNLFLMEMLESSYIYKKERTTYFIVEYMSRYNQILYRINMKGGISEESEKRFCMGGANYLQEIDKSIVGLINIREILGFSRRMKVAVLDEGKMLPIYEYFVKSLPLLDITYTHPFMLINNSILKDEVETREKHLIQNKSEEPKGVYSMRKLIENGCHVMMDKLRYHKSLRRIDEFEEIFKTFLWLFPGNEEKNNKYIHHYESINLEELEELPRIIELNKYSQLILKLLVSRFQQCTDREGGKGLEFHHPLIMTRIPHHIFINKYISK